MKKNLLVVFISTVLGVSIHAQSTFQTTPATSFNETTPISSDINNQLISKVYFKNIITNDIKLKWKVLERNIPTDWEYSMCDYITCRADFLDSTEYTMYPLEPGIEAYLWFHVLPHSLGMAVLKVCVYDVDFPNNCQTVTWTVNSTTDINELNSALHFSIFPNPASEYLHIQGENIDLQGATISLYNTLGQQLMDMPSTSSSLRIDLTPYKNGIYLIRINTKDGFTTKKIIISR